MSVCFSVLLVVATCLIAVVIAQTPSISLQNGDYTELMQIYTALGAS